MITGICTGADNTLHVNVALQMQGMRGEDIVDDTCWVIKSHSPWIMPEAPIFHANKCIVIVRNPLDTNLSWLHLVAMNNHATKSPFNYEELYPNYFDWWVKDCCTHINAWMQQMMHDAKFRQVPILFIRFEDLVMNPEPELYNLMRFMLGTRDLAGTNAERRIKEVLAMGTSATQTYSLKDSTKKNNANVHRYTEDQLAWVRENMSEMLHFFGYAKVPHDPENNTGFFEYDGSDPEMTRQYKGWQAQNAGMVDWACQLTDADLENYRYRLSDPAKEVPLMTFASSTKATKAIMNFYEKKMYNTHYENID